jgi:hypothetical protein
MMIKNISNLLLWGGALAGGGSGGGDTPSGGEEWIGDGNTHIWIHLEEGRTSPMLGCCPNGTVTVDWGDGTAPDVLTGTSTNTSKPVWTPTHNYAAAGDYVITLTVDGEIVLGGNSAKEQGAYILRHSAPEDGRNHAYRKAVRKIEIGNSVTNIGDYAFGHCYSLASINIPNGVTNIGYGAFYYCYSLTSITIPDGVTNLSNATFYHCYNLTSITIPDGITNFGDNAFSNCYSLTSITIPDGVIKISKFAFHSCYSLTSITIPDSVTNFGNNVFFDCYSIARIRFDGTTPPAAPSSSNFDNIPTDCIISVPVGCLDAYKTATNYPDPAKYTYVEE